MNLGMIGPAIVLGLSCLGSAIGCGIGAMAGLGVMARVDEKPRKIHRPLCHALIAVHLWPCPHDPHERANQSQRPPAAAGSRHWSFRGPCDHVLSHLPRHVRSLWHPSRR